MGNGKKCNMIPGLSFLTGALLYFFINRVQKSFLFSVTSLFYMTPCSSTKPKFFQLPKNSATFFLATTNIPSFTPGKVLFSVLKDKKVA